VIDDSALSSFEAEIARLAASFRERTAREAEALDGLADRLSTNDASGARSEIRRAAHKIAGTAGMFGFRDLSDAAARLEDLALSDAADEELVLPTRAFVTMARQADQQPDPES
jgi:HPt (histidine-containing phosphotransfer) domain-containing protein